jgi:peroxiredoxin
MTIALLLARLVLSSVFAVAAVGKLADPAGTRRAARELGASERLAALTVRLLPLFELVIAVALLPTATAQAAALAALALLGLFTVQVARALSGGVQPDCHCFGRLHHRTAGWRVVARDAVLAVIAGFVAISPGTATDSLVPSWLSGLSVGGMIALAVAVVEAVALVLVGALALQLVRRHGNLLLRIDELEGRRVQSGPRIGSEAPGFSLPTFEGEQRSLNDLLQRGSTLLVFSDPMCGPCVKLLSSVARWHTEPASVVKPVLITSGDLASNQAALKGHNLGTALWDEQRGVAHGYGVQGTPSAVLVTEGGQIASQTVLGAPAINRLVGQITDIARAVAPPSASGSTAPMQRRGQASTRLPIPPPIEVYR